MCFFRSDPVAATWNALGRVRGRHRVRELTGDCNAGESPATVERYRRLEEAKLGAPLARRDAGSRDTEKSNSLVVETERATDIVHLRMQRASQIGLSTRAFAEQFREVDDGTLPADSDRPL